MTEQFLNIPFVSYFLTTNNHDNPNFIERDTFSYRFNRNIVTHTQSRYLVAHIPKSFEELVLPWPLLFVDNDAIDKGKVFDEKDKEEFNILFSRVETEATTDVKVHAQKMEKFFSQFQFNDKARMLSVVLHDNLDGEFLFVGHVGILVPADDGFLFVEKLTFVEPYQAIKFASKEDCYKYLSTKYADYTGDGLAKPFIMDNEKWVEGY